MESFEILKREDDLKSRLMIRRVALSTLTTVTEKCNTCVAPVETEHPEVE